MGVRFSHLEGRPPNHITSADGRYVLVKSVTKDNMEKS